MQAADVHTRLTGMLRLRGDTVQEKRPTGDCLKMFVRLGEPHEQHLSFVHQGHHARHNPAACEVLGGEATPSLLILQLVKVVLDVGAIGWSFIMLDSNSSPVL